MKLILLALSVLVLPLVAAAHEVYVLSAQEVASAMTVPALSPWPVMMANFSQFMFWGFVTAIVLSTVFAMSISHRLEMWCAPTLLRMKKYAPLSIRIGLGASLILGVYSGAFLGPELPLDPTFGTFTLYVQALLFVVGVLILLERALPLAASLILVILGVYAVGYGSYVLTYIDFIGAALFVGLEGVEWLRGRSPILYRLGIRLAPYRWPILRVAFGLSVMYASLYAKFLHNSLAHAVVAKYDLTSYGIFSAFSPEFLVLGAGIIELLAGALLVLGIEVRHTSAFLAFWLTLSLLFFQEAVWPHAILFGLGIGFILYGYDRYSLEGYFFKKGRREPVL